MTLSELILLIHYEAQKSYNLVDVLSRTKSDDTLNIHLAMEKLELTLPISIDESEVDYKKIEREIKENKYRQFYAPLVFAELKSKAVAKKTTGKILEVKVKSSADKKTEGTKDERFGQLTITLKPIQG